MRIQEHEIRVPGFKSHGISCVTADFFMTSLGECLRKNQLLACSSLNLGDVCRKYGFSTEDIPNRGGKLTAAQRRFREAEEHEWELLYRRELTPAEYKFHKRMEAFQVVVASDRFRVYGELRKGKARIALVTEFRYFTDDASFWDTLYAKLKELKACVEIMDVSEYSDHHYRCDALASVFESGSQSHTTALEKGWQRRYVTPAITPKGI